MNRENLFSSSISFSCIVYGCFIILFLSTACRSAHNPFSNSPKVRVVPVDSGWARNSVNAAVFRKNSLVSWKDTQFIAFYNEQRYVVLGKRKLGSGNWELVRTTYRGNAADAHNVISIMTDGDGYLHIAWDHHNNRIHYVKSIHPGSLVTGPEQPMTGHDENRISYPEFYRLPDGDLIFFYRDGSSGNGNLVINRYRLESKQWVRLQSNLIDGEGQRNAYWQSCIDRAGVIHLSWVWRETPDVASNHDLCYARSVDGGKNWERSNGTPYKLPITESTAEKILSIPQNSELINQTSMYADAGGHIVIGTYWRDSGSSIPQYHVVYKHRKDWHVQSLAFRKTGFSLSGTGTKRIPISRPQVIAFTNKGRLNLALIFRDEERGSRVSLALCADLQKQEWKLMDLNTESLGSWEPTYDTELWKQKQELHLFVQKVEQADAEGQTQLPPQLIEVLEWNPFDKK